MTRLVLELTVEGEPRAKGRPRFASGHAFTPKGTRVAEERLAWEARAKHRTLTSAPLEVWLEFHMSTRRRVDTDNLCKLALDSLNGVVWADDSQIRALHVKREQAPGRPRTVVRVYELGEEAA